MIKTENLVIYQSVNNQDISILTDSKLYILDSTELEKFIVKCVENGTAQKFDL